MRSVDLLIDVSELGDGQPLRQAVTIHLPDDPPPEAVVVFALPGATYSRGYFDLSRPGVMDASYSQASHHTDRGLVLVAIDHLGTGESTVPADPFAYGAEELAAGNAAVVADVVQRLAKGSLADDLAGLTPVATLGIGQSMGGCLLTVQQGRHHTFDAVGILGWSGRHTNFPDGKGGRLIPTVPQRHEDLRRAEMTVAFTPEQIGYCFHYEDEPPAVVGADSSMDAPWRSTGVPPCTLAMLSPGFVADEAAAIDVPVFVASGERDVIPEPHAEPLAYPSSPDVTVTVFPRMAHMHNFAGTRLALWDRLVGWISSLGYPV